MSVQSFFRAQQQLIPEALMLFRRRYDVLHHLTLHDGIGRRLLAKSLRVTERVLRNDIDFLKEQNLILIDQNGMRLSPLGVSLLEQLRDDVTLCFGLQQMAQQLKERWQLDAVFIAPGHCDETAMTTQDMGRLAGQWLMQTLENGQIVTVTGGSTLAAITAWLKPSTHLKDCIFLPARGGLGEHFEWQANAIVSKMAQHIGAQYRLLHVPDYLSDEAYQSLKSEPNVQHILEILQHVDIVLHGIGDGLKMAQRRQLDNTTIEKLKNNDVVGEAYGCYFNDRGEVIHQTSTLGLQLEQLYRAQHVVAIAGGLEKVAAITAALRHGQITVLITDEAVAKQLIAVEMS